MIDIGEMIRDYKIKKLIETILIRYTEDKETVISYMVKLKINNYKKEIDYKLREFKRKMLKTLTLKDPMKEYEQEKLLVYYTNILENIRIKDFYNL